MNIYRTERFKKDFSKLPKEVREKLSKGLNQFEENERHPSLQVKRMEGTQDIWEMRISIHHRLTFHKLKDGILLRRIGSHDILKFP
jgi:mRNA-degrading endonuclease RelE of RelBE toxin-antitoxin system